jgi:two-component system sensor histidine kinase/response regulator
MNFDSLLLEASSEILMLLDAQSLTIVAASSAAHKQLGYQAPALIGMTIGDIECALSDLFFWEEMAAATGLVEAQSSYRRQDGSVLEVRKFAQRVGTDHAHYLLRARQARVQRVDPGINITGLHLAATLEATDDGILLIDIDGTILNMNHRFSRLMGLPDRLLAERDDHGIVGFIESALMKSPGTSDAPTALSQAIDLKLDLGGDTFETLYMADGRVLECVSHPARDRDHAIGRVFCYRDITQRVQHEQFLQEARDIAEQATLSKGQFLANMSHEIRTPMNAILGMLKLTQSTDLNARQLDYINKAEGAAQSLLGLLNDILDFSKIEAGKLELDPQPFAPERIWRELSVILAASLANKPVELLYDIDPKVPALLWGDAMRLQQVLINLGGNALKFTQTGEVVVRVRVLDPQPQATRLYISVQDSGIGIAPENQAKIFGDFSQAEASTTRRYGGTGLGLSICKRLVELMGGQLQVTSALGQGSNFFFEITLPQPPMQSAAPAVLATPEALDILVIDDNPVARDLLGTMLQSIGWQVTLCSSGEEAVQTVLERARASERPFHAIFVDWEMPGMDGWETMAQLRSLGTAYGAPVCVMLTSHSRQGLSQRSTQEQAALHAFLMKPVTCAMLQEAVADARAGKQNFRRGERKRVATGHRLNGMRLLVVEDNLVNQQVARELLASEGAQVELADNGLMALAALRMPREAPFHAVLMDVQMPVMDGFTATRAIRKELGLLDLPVIAMTANAMASDREDCLDAGMNDHVGKPFDLNYLVTVLLQSSGYQPATAPLLAPEVTAPPSSDLAAMPAAVGAPSSPPSPTPADAQVETIDLDCALRNLEGMKDLYLDLARQFQIELESAVSDLHHTLCEPALADAMRQLHTLKGTAATLGAMPLSDLARALEHTCKTEGVAAVLAREAELTALVNATKTALQATIDRLSAELAQ